MNCFCPEMAPAHHDHNLEYDEGHVFQRVSRGEVPEVEAVQGQALLDQTVIINHLLLEPSRPAVTITWGEAIGAPRR